jgi:hypothetical protein
MSYNAISILEAGFSLYCQILLVIIGFTSPGDQLNEFDVCVKTNLHLLKFEQRPDYIDFRKPSYQCSIPPVASSHLSELFVVLHRYTAIFGWTTIVLTECICIVIHYLCFSLICLALFVFIILKGFVSNESGSSGAEKRQTNRKKYIMFISALGRKRNVGFVLCVPPKEGKICL